MNFHIKILNLWYAIPTIKKQISTLHRGCAVMQLKSAKDSRNKFFTNAYLITKSLSLNVSIKEAVGVGWGVVTT